MTKIIPAMTAVAAMLSVMPATAHAQIRFFVSGTGDDANACSRTLPCKTFGGVLGKPGSAAEIEINCLDVGDFGGSGFTITKSVTIDCGGVQGAVIGLAANNAIVINGAGIIVRLRNLAINGVSQVSFGINAMNMAALFIERCTITRMNETTGVGINFAPPSGVTAKLQVSDSVIAGNGLAASGGGIIIQPTGSGSARVVIERTLVEGNTYGIFANGMGSTGTISVQVKDSVVANNAFNGISAFTAAGKSTTSLTVDRSSSLLNGADGILAQGAPAFVTLANSTVASNVTGLHSLDGGNIFSFQDNHIAGNVTDGAPTGMLTVK